MCSKPFRHICSIYIVTRRSQLGVAGDPPSCWLPVNMGGKNIMKYLLRGVYLLHIFTVFKYNLKRDDAIQGHNGFYKCIFQSIFHLFFVNLYNYNESLFV